jgi:hypothetical protein
MTTSIKSTYNNTHYVKQISKPFGDMNKDELLNHIDKLENKILVFEQTYKKNEDRKRYYLEKLNHFFGKNGQMVNNKVIN